jgi:hypothetical protein
MFKTISSLLIIAIALLCSAASFAQAEKTAQSKTVVDYYMSIPDEYLSRDMLPDRKKGISIEDVKNGYLKITGPWEGFAEIALFKKSNGDYLIGLTVANCGPGCEQEIHFLENNGGKWTDKTKEVLPTISNSTLEGEYKKKKSAGDPQTLSEAPALYMLPRYGTTIQIVAQPEFTKKKIVLQELTFNKEKFAIAK